MDAPLLLALARARLRAGEGSVQGAWASPRALALLWAPDRRAGLEPGLAWIFVLNPAPELWLLQERDEAYRLLKAEARTDLSRRWAGELKGTRLTEVQGDPRERWLGMVLRRRAITGRIEAARLTFQAIPGRAGLRLDGLDLNPARMGLGHLFPAEPPEPGTEPPPLQRFRERFGASADAALAGDIPDVLPGEPAPCWPGTGPGPWSVRPGWCWPPARPWRTASWRPNASAWSATGTPWTGTGSAIPWPWACAPGPRPWRRSCTACGESAARAELLDGTAIELPDGLRAEEAVQRWFHGVKRAERGLARLQDLERELHRQMKELELREAQQDPARADPAALPAPSGPAPGVKRLSEKTGKRTAARTDARADGKGKAFRTVMVEGFEVLIGKGDADNDQLTFKVAAPHDLWLHVANPPGSHVVVRNPERIAELPRALIERAAELAAFFSKARDGGKAEVHYCRAADVSKPRGFPPGKVLLKQWKSVRVYPRE